MSSVGLFLPNRGVKRVIQTGCRIASRASPPNDLSARLTDRCEAAAAYHDKLVTMTRDEETKLLSAEVGKPLSFSASEAMLGALAPQFFLQSADLQLVVA